MDKNKNNCDFCGDYIQEDDENQLYFMVDNSIRHYCSKCSKHVDNVREAVERKINYYKSNHIYYEINHVFKMIESLYKHGNGSMKISFENRFNYNENMIGTPIIKDNIPVGYISDVNEKEITGFIWDKYMPIITNLLEDKVSSFEIVY